MSEVDLVIAVFLLSATVCAYMFCYYITQAFFDERFPEQKTVALMFKYEKLREKEYQKAKPNARKIDRYNKILCDLEMDLYQIRGIKKLYK